jgi:hypothetical protein
MSKWRNSRNLIKCTCRVEGKRHYKIGYGKIDNDPILKANQSKSSNTTRKKGFFN